MMFGIPLLLVWMTVLALRGVWIWALDGRTAPSGDRS